MSLADVQARFQAAVRGEGGAPPLRGRQAAQGLRVYAHAYPARLREALADNFPALAQALGDGAFAEQADAYARAHPPTEASIRWHGAQFAAFLASQPDLHPALADLARLDWALRQAFDGGAAPVPDLAALPPEAWATTRLRLQDHATLLPLAWAVAPAWHALQAAREAGTEAELPAPEAVAHTLLVGREALRTQWRTLTPDEADALQRLLAATSLAAWLEGELALHGDTALPQAIAWLQGWVADQSLATA